ncbi:MAG: hypothetical protein IJS45_07605 [Clostridia bacterium]|nr:hypothetical protein [Clostridia bacterium]
MGGRGAYWEKIGRDSKPGKTSDDIHFDDKQFGKKVGKHASDFGLNPNDPEGRAKFAEITKNILDNPDEMRIGTWRGQTERVVFYIKGEDVVVVNSLKEYVTTLKNGAQNKRVKGASKI